MTTRNREAEMADSYDDGPRCWSRGEFLRAARIITLNDEYLIGKVQRILSVLEFAEEVASEPAPEPLRDDRGRFIGRPRVASQPGNLA